MAQKLLIDPQAKLVFAWFSGVFTGDDLEQHSRDVLASPHFHSDFNELVDFSEVESFEVTGTDISRVASLSSDAFEAGTKRVIIAPSDLAYGVARMFSMQAESDHSGRVYVARTKAEACTILNINESEVPAR